MLTLPRCFEHPCYVCVDIRSKSYYIGKLLQFPKVRLDGFLRDQSILSAQISYVGKWQNLDRGASAVERITFYDLSNVSRLCVCITYFRDA